MDIRPIYLKEIPRRRREVLPVQHIGYFREKKHRVKHSFQTVNFSFILYGSGNYYINGEILQIEAPCVFMQWPDETNNYGPERGNAWTELYFTYAAHFIPTIQSNFHLPIFPRCWPISNIEHIQSLKNDLAVMTHESELAPQVDRIDLICEQMIMESLPTFSSTNDSNQARIQRILDEVESDFLKLSDVDALARGHGFSRSSYRRLWPLVCPTPPSRHLIELKLVHASRLLVETQLPISSIGDQIGFNDAFYFSRKFSKRFKVSPSTYRKIHKM